MKHLSTHIINSLLVVLLFLGCTNDTKPEYDIIIAGGGASGVMAAIQAARMDKTVLIIEETEWLGGMITAAGVSAIDGNYELPSGLWEEFRTRITNHYGGMEAVKTGWVSNVLFEPDVAADLLDSMVEEVAKIDVHRKSAIIDARYKNNIWEVTIDSNDRTRQVSGRILIDATELGDIIALLDVPHHIGMDSRSDTGEAIAPELANDIIQDLTYVAILEKIDSSTAIKLIEPEGYDPELFRCTCQGYCDPAEMTRTLWPCDQMMEYGKLPNEKIMINWPINGNDYYVNALDLSNKERKIAFEKAKHFTKCYIHYLQSELGYDEWRVVKDIFPTEDGFPMIPYHRESRRVEGLVTFDLNDLAEPYNQEDYLYKTGIAVGDYPIDHHHAAYPEADKLPDLHFYPVPSYTIPLGSLIPKSTQGLIVAEKSISVTHIVNGTTRLQPVCMLIGQAAGTIAAIAIEKNILIEDVPIREVQNQLLDDGAYIQPYSDVPRAAPEWAAIQRIGATGLIKGEGKNVGWKNYMLFHPDSTMRQNELITNLTEMGFNLREYKSDDELLTLESILALLQDVIDEINWTDPTLELRQIWDHMEWGEVKNHVHLTRKVIAVILDYLLHPFDRPIDHEGHLIIDPQK